ncbi:MAG: SGNH/GDSL hydrolase family protein [Verrucomicrobiota bacterium]
MTRHMLFLMAASLLCLGAATPAFETKPNAACFEKFIVPKAPATKGLLLKPGDRLAICGDSITEQKMYSRAIETYLTVCMPELNITVRQYGWSGERANGFLARMTNDCLRFRPTIATTCYGMNDHQYRPFEPAIGDAYRSNSLAIVRAFKANGVRVVQGSPGTVGKMPHWVKSASGTVDDLNLSLCELRTIGIDIATQEKVAFADVFWPMLKAGYYGQEKYGTNFFIAGKDGVHPGWAGQAVMAYAFLKSLGVDGNIGRFTVDLAAGKATVSMGHELIGYRDGELQIKSTRYPFCATGSITNDNSIRAGMSLAPFNQELNRFMLVVTNSVAARYKITWGAETRTYTARQLARGVNLADDFATNPFSEAFGKVDRAVLAKQAYETKQIKQLFRAPEAKTNFAAVVQQTEAERAPLAEAIKTAFVPVTHAIKIAAE